MSTIEALEAPPTFPKPMKRQQTSAERFAEIPLTKGRSQIDYVLNQMGDAKPGYIDKDTFYRGERASIFSFFWQATHAHNGV